MGGGPLIPFQNHFDSEDEIEAASVVAEVESVFLFATHLGTAENREMIVSNNMTLDNVVVNSTGAPTGCLSIEIEVNVEERGLDDSEETLKRVMVEHPGALDEPEPDPMLSAITAGSDPWPLRGNRTAAKR